MKFSLTLTRFVPLWRWAFYAGPWTARPIWSMNRHRKHILWFWRLYTRSSGCSREVMKALLAADLRAKKAKFLRDVK